MFPFVNVICLQNGNLHLKHHSVTGTPYLVKVRIWQSDMFMNCEFASETSFRDWYSGFSQGAHLSIRYVYEM